LKKYVAFLRGVNLGKRTVKKEELMAAFSAMGATGVQTVLASGNVLFEYASPPMVSELEAGTCRKVRI
jgi:uncharacterized protein (DUF1697 family)